MQRWSQGCLFCFFNGRVIWHPFFLATFCEEKTKLAINLFLEGCAAGICFLFISQHAQYATLPQLIPGSGDKPSTPMSGMLGLPPFLCTVSRLPVVILFYFFPHIISWQNATCQCPCDAGLPQSRFVLIF